MSLPIATPRLEASGQLRHIVAVNEQIKAVIRIALQVRLMALNAILLSRRAGDVARGFGVLSLELRDFAAELGSIMEELREVTEGSVATVSLLIRQVRRGDILQRVEASEGAAMVALQRVREARDRLIAEQESRLRNLQRRLCAQLDRLQPLILFGTVLVRSARIESAYGGSLAPQLSQVSEEFGQGIDTINLSIAGLRQQALAA